MFSNNTLPSLSCPTTCRFISGIEFFRPPAAMACSAVTLWLQSALLFPRYCHHDLCAVREMSTHWNAGNIS